MLLGSALLSVALGGCGEDGPGAALDDYVSRLERALDTTAPATSPLSTLELPRVGKLQLELPRGSIGALDFLALRGCALQVTVGKRNTSLGRLAPPSQQLLLELEFLRLAPACINTLRERGEGELAVALSAAMETKREQLPVRIFNATLGSEEFRSLWQAPAILGNYPQSTNSEPPAALAAIDALGARWLAGDFAADNQELELLLSAVARGDGGELLAALALQQAALTRADGVLQRRASRGPLCRGGLVPRELTILRNVVRRFFIAGVQPWSAAVERRRQLLLPPLRALEERLAPVLPASYRDWRTARDRRLEDAARAPRRHVGQIQALLEDCPGGPGLAPG
jgi:hypothetical protein